MTLVLSHWDTYAQNLFVEATGPGSEGKCAVKGSVLALLLMLR